MQRAAVIATLVFAASCGRHSTVAIFPVVSPASGPLLTSHFASDAYVEHTMSRAATGDTTERESLVAHIDEAVGLGSADATILRVTTGHYAGGDYYDSLLVRRRDLRPIREHIRYAQRQIDKRFDYDGGKVHQINAKADSATSFDRAYDVPVFAFSEIELLLRSLPYRAGYTAIVPLYSEGDDAIEMDSVSVIDSGPQRWTIRFADPAIIATYGLDTSTRRILSYDVVSRKTSGRARKVYDRTR